MFEKEIDRISRRWEQKLETIAWAKSLNLDTVNCNEVSIYADYITLTIPPFSDFGKFRRSIGPGWHRYSQHTSGTGDRFIGYHYKNDYSKRLVIVIDAYLANGSCERVQVGTKEIPQFEIICN